MKTEVQELWDQKENKRNDVCSFVVIAPLWKRGELGSSHSSQDYILFSHWLANENARDQDRTTKLLSQAHSFLAP